MYIFNGGNLCPWEILPVESDGTPRWEYSSYTDSIAGYEDLFDQDLDGGRCRDGY